MRKIRKGKANETHFSRFVFSPTAAALRELVIVSKKMLKEACARPEPLPVERLELAFVADKKSLAELAASPSFPRLERMTFGVTQGNVEKLIGLVAGFVAERPLRKVALRPMRRHEETVSLAKWLGALLGPLGSVPEVAVVFWDGSEIVARKGGAGLALEIISDSVLGRELLHAIPSVTDVSLRVLGHHGEPLRFADRALAHQAFARFTRMRTDAVWNAFLAPPVTEPER